MQPILMVSPTQALSDTFARLSREMKVDIECVVARNIDDLERIVNQYRDTQVFISRGGLAEKLRNHYSKTVISLELSTQNIFNAICSAAHKNKSIAVLLYSSSTIEVDSEFNLSDVNILWKEYHTELISPLISDLVNHGITAVIGSKTAVVEAEMQGIEGFLVDTDVFSIKSAIQEGEALLALNQRQNEKNKIWRNDIDKLIEDLYHTIASVNVETNKLYASSQEITALNYESQSMLQSLERDLVGISEIIQLVKRISRQTNLIGINASIEAARAGTYGNGFAIVAEEVSRLATESNKSSHEIENKIVAFLKHLTLNIEKNNINSELVEEQSSGIGVINSMVANIDNVCKSLKRMASLER